MATSGWYNDESDPTLVRWHDGVGWTEHVADKAEWLALGHAPPPPDEWEPVGPGRLRALVAAGAVVAVLVIGGVALARDGGGDGPGRTPTVGQRGAAGGTRDTTADASDRVGDAPVTTGGAGPSASGDGPVGTTDPAAARSSTSRTTVRTSGAVQRTETATHTNTSPGPVTETGKGDQSSVGNTTNTTITIGYVPPPPEASTTTEAPTTTTPTDETSSTIDQAPPTSP